MKPSTRASWAAARPKKQNATRGFAAVPGFSDVSFAERQSRFIIPGSRWWKPNFGLCPRRFGAALTAKTAGWMGDWDDGLITVRKSKQSMQELVGRFENNGGGCKPLVLQLQVSWAASKEEAAWEQWRSAAVPPTVLADLKRPKDFEEFTKNPRPDDVDIDRGWTELLETANWDHADLEKFLCVTSRGINVDFCGSWRRRSCRVSDSHIIRQKAIKTSA